MGQGPKVSLRANLVWTTSDSRHRFQPWWFLSWANTGNARQHWKIILSAAASRPVIMGPPLLCRTRLPGLRYMGAAPSVVVHRDSTMAMQA